MRKKMIAIVMVLSMIAIGTISAYATDGNTDDTTYRLVLSPTNSESDYAATSCRQKFNASAVYFKVNYVKSPSHDLTGWVQGKDNSGIHNCSGGHYYSVNFKDTFKMTNYVREDGYGYARVKVGADPKDTNTIEGVWSPDSKK